jgi:division protein 1
LHGWKTDERVSSYGDTFTMASYENGSICISSQTFAQNFVLPEQLFRAMSDERPYGRDVPGLQASVRTLLPSANSLLVDLAPQLLQHRILNHNPHRLIDMRARNPSGLAHALSTLGRVPGRLLLPSARTSSHRTAVDLAILEQVDELLSLPIPSASTSSGFNPQLAIQAAPQTQHAVSLLAGFQATTPASSKSRQARRKRRAHLGESHLGYRSKSDGARGLLSGGDDEDFVMVSPEARRHTMGGPDFMPDTPSRPSKGRARKSMAELGYGASEASTPVETREELEQDVTEIERDRAHIEVRRKLVLSEIEDVDSKITALDKIRTDLKKALLTLREEELELADESAWRVLSAASR